MNSSQMTPLVTVIIPNYNHARYLPRRIESVLQQTVGELEVLILDDCSPDQSREVIAGYAARDGRIRTVFNAENSGSTFRQWNKGLALARGTYVWIAESDDYAAPTFLETLLAPLEAHPHVGLAYCGSWVVDEENVITGDHDIFLGDLDPDLWKHDFVMNGLSIVRKFMSYRNIIPNASAVVLRRQVLEQVGPADEEFRLNGDWLFWAKILSESDIAFVSQKLNYFRKHSNNVRSATVTNGIALLELTRVFKVIQKYGEPDAFFFNEMFKATLELWFRSMVEHRIPLKRHRLIYNNLVDVDKSFTGRFRRDFSKFLVGNNFSGVRQLLGDGLLYKIIKRKV
ncbi:glycosyltransferase family 2 protein [Hymenobacter sp. BT491]|uniref:glycosyltransferase family 2 protein n=1 Tax=Hymenobacter sp. BT491 TaxID=2766779 RepID=UPI0016536AEA|nr:glycosyltransferase family A protein [Hymenobacter sp. BT491]MBC6988293.1 glycosyltransferase family 2 protein [Hymenobacter sp. BT491]